jgi:hypothetical protein
MAVAVDRRPIARILPYPLGDTALQGPRARRVPPASSSATPVRAHAAPPAVPHAAGAVAGAARLGGAQLLSRAVREGRSVGLIFG